jgi:uncharacterized membrane protein
MRNITLADGFAVIGLLLLFAGLAGYDWRLSLCVTGGLLLVAGAFGIVRGA